MVRENTGEVRERRNGDLVGRADRVLLECPARPPRGVVSRAQRRCTAGAELTPPTRHAADDTVRTRAVAPGPTHAVATVIRAVLLTIVAIGVGGSAGFYVALHFS
jgi:hypothetical protein